MAPVSRLGRQIQEVLRCLDDLGAASALIGGLALAPYRVIRATSDVDLLIDARLADAIDGAIRSLGYECLHRSSDAANYVRGDERVAQSRADYPRPAVSVAEAFTMLDDLMAVVESLCTSWPAKPAMTRMPDLRL